MKKGDLVRWWSDTNGDTPNGFGIVLSNDGGYVEVVWITKKTTEVEFLAESSVRVINGDYK